MSITDLLDGWFESDELKGNIDGGGVIGAWTGPDGPGTAYVLLHNEISDVDDGTMGSWGYPRGGMGAVSAAIRRSAESVGCQVRTGARVTKILTQGGRVLGTALDSGEEFRAPVVVSAVHPKLAFLQLLDRGELPEEFAKDKERLQRFEREARLLASTNHPNIAVLHGFEYEDEISFLVMELVSGQTLGERLKAGPVGVDEVLGLVVGGAVHLD